MMKRYGLIFYNEEEALNKVLTCRENNNEIFGIDVVRIENDSVYPIAQYDFTSDDYVRTFDNVWEEAVSIISKFRKTYLFEIITKYDK